MCPPGPFPKADIGSFWTDEDLIFCLVKIQHGSPPPDNVLTDINPFEHEPSNLPDDFWFLLHSENQNETETGCWKARGKECKIYADSKLTGWRTTFEYFEGQSHNRLKTEWLMQKYWITLKGSNNLKASSSLYRVFYCEEGCTVQKRQRCLLSCNLGGEESTSLGQDNSSMPPNGSAEIPQENVIQGETKSTYPDQHQDDVDCFSTGDYLELLDLVNPCSSSSSSDNSSCVSMASDDVFDYLALLNDLEPENAEEVQSKSSSSKFSVSMSSVPRKVLIPPATSGSVMPGEISQSADPLDMGHPSPDLDLNEKIESKNVSEHSEQSHISKNKNDPLPKCDEASTSRALEPDKGKKIALKKMKLLRKKYLCFMPF